MRTVFLGLDSRRLLIIILWLVTLHTVAVGIALIAMPISWLSFFGFSVIEKFFTVQGGVFHLVLGMVYVSAALDIEHADRLVQISIAAKFTATVFLITYYLVVNPIWMSLVSGIGDGLMGGAILLAYLAYRRDSHE